MTAIKICLGFALVIIGVQGPSKCLALDKPEVVSICDGLSSIFAVLSAQPSLQVEAVSTKHFEKGVGFDGTPDMDGVYKLFYRGNQFLYDVDVKSEMGSVYSKVENFDGASYSLLNRNGQRMLLSTSPFMNDVAMFRAHMLFLPFLFVLPDFKKNPFPQLSYKELTSLESLKNAQDFLLKPGVLKDVALGDQSCVMATLGSVYEGIQKKQGTFDVYFSKQAKWYPIKWVTKTEKGELLTEYVVDTLGAIKTPGGDLVPFPEQATLKFYVKNKLAITQKIRITHASFGSVSDDDLTVDLGAASLIHDMDKNVDIKVPR